MLFASLGLVFTALTWTGSVTTVAAQDGGYSPDDQELAFVDLLNQYRGSLGLASVSLNSELGAAAEYHSYDMATNNYFSHYAPDGTDPVTNINNFGYYGLPSSENIEAGVESAQDVLVGWQNSPEHNATMTNPQFTEVGVGRYYDPNSYYGWYWTAEYGAGNAPSQEPVAASLGTDTGTDAPAPVDAAPVDASVPVDTSAPAPDDGTLIGQPGTETVIDDSSKGHGHHRNNQGDTDGMTTTVQEPPTVTTDNGTVELGQDAVNADGDRAVSTGTNPVANGEGDTVIYGDINTGGVQGETIIYEPPSYTVNGETTTLGPAPSSTTNTTTTYAPPPAAPASEPVYTDPTLTETTTTNISMEDGTGRALG
jgi:uncharacterized protein YkwD